MTVANLKAPPPTMTAPPAQYGYDTANGALAGQRLFKKHKVLPHPRRHRSEGMPIYDSRSVPRKYDLVVDTAVLRRHGSQPASPPFLKHQARRIGSGPDLPPTPPAHSRNSSSSKSILPSSPILVESPVQTIENAPIRAPVTPPNQKSPPTPDVTPPQPLGRPRALRPMMSDRASSKATGSESRTESFKTAREDPYSSEEEDSKSTVRLVAPSARTSQVTVRHIPEEKPADPEISKLVGLGLGLESGAEDNLTPKSNGEFVTFDGDWASSSEVEQEWDDNLQRTVTVRKRRQAPETPRANGRKEEVIEDAVVTPTNATKALRSMPLHDRIMTYPTPKDFSDRDPLWSAPSTSDPSISADVRRFSGMSSRSTVSTVVEAILVDTPPRRRMTLRHVRKQRTLRDSSSDLSPGSSAPSSSIRLDETLRQPRASSRRLDGRHESYASNSTINSVSSGKARREVWKNGGIPVVIVPDRMSSVKSKSSREPSLRSTSSRRSKRSTSLGSTALLNGSKSKDLTPLFDRPSRRSRTMSDSDGSDQRTIDFPPVIPKRSSSLSAPTSRNNSRAGSLTAESLKARSAIQHHQAQQEVQKTPTFALQRAPSFESGKDEHLHTHHHDHHHDHQHHDHQYHDHQHHDHQHHRLDVDRHGDPFFGRRLSAQNTPFSQASVETNGTALEVSEAMAVNIYPHQNTSVVMVDHSSKPSEGSETSQKEKDIATQPERPKITTTAPDGEGPVTPPQPQFSMDDVDSPLRNPRAPPEPPVDPPAIKFIPATPSGLTPANEKQHLMGNYFEAVGADKPKRSMSLVRMALTRRRHSESYPPKTTRPGFLTRTLSLSRNVRKDPEAATREKGKSPIEPPYPTIENPPAEGNKLHPFWRPAYSDNEDEDWVHDIVDDPDDKVYKYPPIDNRPPLPRRSLSSRMKRTFAILPINDDDDDYYPASGQEGPDRRTIRRTASGNLRVMRHRGSLDSVRPEQQAHDSRPYTAPEDNTRPKHFWHNRSRSKDEPAPADVKKRRFSVSGTLEGLQNLPRRMSERRREKRTQELRQKISGPREVRDGVGEVVRPRNYRDSFQQTNF